MLTLRANAKINLYLRVLGKEANGYHELDMVMQSLDLADTLLLERKENGVSLSPSGLAPEIPLDDSNAAVRAAKAFFSYTDLPGGVAIQLEKHIPSAAGLGGASADAAAVLVGLNHLFGSPLGKFELRALGKTLGADVPFALEGGCMRAQGIGEVLTPLYNNLGCTYLLVKPTDGVQTPAAFAAYDALGEPASFPGIQGCIQALQTGDLEEFSVYCKNALFQAASSLCPAIEQAWSFLASFHPTCQVMTGSGSTLVGLFKEERKARAAKKEALSRGYFACLAHSAQQGVQLFQEKHLFL